MAKRPVFIAQSSGILMVVTLPVEFTWNPGMAKSQKQKSIRSLHNSAMKINDLHSILEISSKSEAILGVRLSAFNLMLQAPDGSPASVEALFQGSKVFSHGGPYTDLYKKAPWEAKKDVRLKQSGHLLAFRCGNHGWPINPQTVFYNWLYLSALQQNPFLAREIMKFDGFSDIEFNPEKSINCQAASAALYKSLMERKLLDIALSSPDNFLRIHKEHKINFVPVQQGLF